MAAIISSEPRHSTDFPNEYIGTLAVELDVNVAQVDYFLLTIQGFPREVAYVIGTEESPEIGTFNWTIAGRRARNLHRFIPTALRGQGLGRLIMEHAEKFMSQNLQVRELAFRALKTENIAFAQSMGYELPAEVESRLNLAIGEKQEWVYQSFWRRFFEREWGQNCELLKTLSTFDTPVA